MAVGKGERGPLWAVGEITARVRGPGPSTARIARARRPFALIGRDPAADFRLDDPAVEPAHVLLILDRRGVFGVDLLTGAGTRFAGLDAGSAWLGPGDILEVAGHRVELLRLRVDGRAIDPPPCPDDPLAAGPEVDVGLASVALEPLDGPGPPWMIGSALAFLGRAEACAIRVDDPSTAPVHCALLRTPTGAHLIDLLGGRTSLDDRALVGASGLVDGDLLVIGRHRFAVRIGPPWGPRSAPTDRGEIALRRASPTVPMTRAVGPLPPAEAPPGGLLAWLVEAALRGSGSSQDEVVDAVRRLRADTALFLGMQDDRIEELEREIARLGREVRGPSGLSLPAAEPLRLDLRPTAARGDSAESAAWLLDRINGLDPGARSTWKHLIGRITAAVQPRPGAPGRLAASPPTPTGPETTSKIP